MKHIRLNESQFRKLISESVKRILKEGYNFNHEKFNEWKETPQIPQEVMNMVHHIAEKVGCQVEDEEEVITLYNRGGHPYGYGKGFTLTHCTFSMEDGPGVDYSSTMIKWLKGLDFYIENSHGDNGMDPAASGGRDTYWSYEFVYKPSIVYSEQFDEWDGNEDDYDEDDYDW